MKNLIMITYHNNFTLGFKTLHSSLQGVASRKGLHTGNNSIVPVVVYSNTDTQKVLILKDNKLKSGVYRWINKENGKTYIGSSINLGKRFSKYFSILYLTNSKANMAIEKALLKYGYSGFSLEILEYCEPSETTEREQYYMDLLKPEYNILPVAGSRLGHKHTEETLTKFRARKLSEEHAAALTKHNSSLEQRLKSREGMLKINSKKGFVVNVINIESGESTKYESIRQAAIELNTSHVTVLKYIKQQKLYLKKFIIKTDKISNEE